MNEITSFFDNLYSKFILRDLFAKIGPGFISMFSTSYFFLGSVERIVFLTKNFTFWHWLVLMSFAWIAGFILQNMGIFMHLLRDDVYRWWIRSKSGLLKEYFKEEKEILDSDTREFRQALERAIVIKEACGNSSMALVYSGILLFRKIIIRCGSINPPKEIIEAEILILIIILISTVVLWNAHKYHAKREDLFRNAFKKE